MTVVGVVGLALAVAVGVFVMWMFDGSLIPADDSDKWGYRDALEQLDTHARFEARQRRRPHAPRVYWLRWESFGQPADSFLLDQACAVVRFPDDTLARLAYRWRDGWSIWICRWDDASDDIAFEAHEDDEEWQHIASTMWTDPVSVMDRIHEHKQIVRQVLANVTLPKRSLDSSKYASTGGRSDA